MPVKHEWLGTPTDLGANATRDISAALTELLADVFLDNDGPYVTPQDTLAELREDNHKLVSIMREAHNTCDEYHDVASTSLLEVYLTRPSGGGGSCSK